ncbi:hypothetical protein E1H12_16255 [Geitlerinema sp. P-1104]|uniref:hypothetical protein n=1 Tax=Geitlerinema sp. P-1104 TaxID=2546230 RepID=UPI0014772B3A|nr:hypothetical protein [Geitlerinema sp. P-1104]NMG60028.1 hypothetical protein [Geitlerinema sp. P-1104]
MSRINWSQKARQMDRSNGLWYKFGQDETTGNWHILCSGDRGSLENNSVVYHDHFWQQNGRWYFQGRSGNQHVIGRDDFIEVIQEQIERDSLNLTEEEKQELNLTNQLISQMTQQQIKKIADYRARQAYGNAGYVGNNHGVEMSDRECQICDQLVRQHQSFTNRLNWHNTNSNITSVKQDSKKALNWREAPPENLNLSSGINPELGCDHSTRKSNRKTTR